MRILTINIEECSDCPHSSIFSVDGIRTARCDKMSKPLKGDGEETVPYQWFEPPEWCPLPKKDNAAT